jgi:hypothetical protein
MAAAAANQHWAADHPLSALPRLPQYLIRQELLMQDDQSVTEVSIPCAWHMI